MEIEFQSTGETGIETMEFNFSSPPSPFGFGGEEPEEEKPTENTPNSPTQEKKDKGKGKAEYGPPIDWQVEYGRRRYKMAIKAADVPGNTDDSKLRTLSKALARLESFTSSKVTRILGVKTIVALFGAQGDAEKTKNLNLGNDTQIHMQEAPIYNPIETKNKTIRAWDIPLNVTQQEVHTAFSKYGEIKALKLTTIGMWQSANIEYTNQDDYNKLALRWAVPFKADLIRIFPFLNTNQIKEDRAQFTLKLINLPPGTTGYDLKDIITDCKAQTCYIPRKRNYLRRQFAILSFKTEAAITAAVEYVARLGNTDLKWVEIKHKLCAICDKEDHLAIDCNIKALQAQRSQQRKDNGKKFGQLYQRFKPAGAPIPTKPTKVVTRPNTGNRPSYANVVKQRPVRPTSKPATNPIAGKLDKETQHTLKEAIQAMKILGEEIQGIKKDLEKMDIRIGQLEDDSYYVHMEQSDIRQALNMEPHIEEPIQEEEQDTITSGRQTPEEQTQGSEDNPFNYQRKRQALSPAQDIREEQQALYSRINRMGDTIEQLTTTFAQFEQLAAEDTLPPPTEQ